MNIIVKQAALLQEKKHHETVEQALAYAAALLLRHAGQRSDKDITLMGKLAEEAPCSSGGGEGYYLRVRHSVLMRLIKSFRDMFLYPHAAG